MDTIYGVTAIVLAPENDSVDHLIPDDMLDDVMAYRQASLAKTAVARQQSADDVSGVDS